MFGNDAPKRSKPALDKWIFERVRDGLRNFIPTVPVDFHDLASTKHQRRHDGEATEGLTQICSSFKIHSKPQEVMICTVSLLAFVNDGGGRRSNIILFDLQQDNEHQRLERRPEQEQVGETSPGHIEELR